MTRIAYARVSSQSQSLDVQIEKLKDCDRIFKEKVSARTDKREQLQLITTMLKFDINLNFFYSDLLILSQTLYLHCKC
jgi:hypothetical protein